MDSSPGLVPAWLHWIPWLVPSWCPPSWPPATARSKGPRGSSPGPRPAANSAILLGKSSRRIDPLFDVKFVDAAREGRQSQDTVCLVKATLAAPLVVKGKLVTCLIFINIDELLSNFRRYKFFKSERTTATFHCPWRYLFQESIQENLIILHMHSSEGTIWNDLVCLLPSA